MSISGRRPAAEEEDLSPGFDVRWGPKYSDYKSGMRTAAERKYRGKQTAFGWLLRDALCKEILRSS